MAIPQKFCTGCNETKPITEFGKHKHMRLGVQSRCKACQSAKDAARYQANREKAMARSAARYQEKHDQILEQNKDYRKRNREHIAKYRRVYQSRRRGELASYHKQYVRANRSGINSYRRNWRLNNPGRERAYRNREVRRAAWHRRRARITANGGSYTVGEWQTLVCEYNHTCLCCGQTEPNIKLTPDHIVPLANGGSNSISNIQPLCLTCNLRKHTKTIDYRPQLKQG